MRPSPKWGKVDIVMANAAIHPWMGSVLDLQDETFNKFMQVNVQSSLWLAQMTVPGMVERGYGRFIAVASIVGLLGDPATGTYGLTKAADMQFVRNMAMEFASKRRLRQLHRAGHVQDRDGALAVGERSPW
jgi:NAD(P)-dependent dehydrogenase (short-subunit alcohol dehydrogenase family)